MCDHLHVVPLYRSRTVTARDVQCRPHKPECSGEEITNSHEIVFPRSGLFVKHVAGREVVADANQVLFFRSGEPYRVSHPVPGGDDCTVYVFSSELLAEAFHGFDPSVYDKPERMLNRTHAPSRPKGVLLNQRFRRIASDPQRTDLNVDELAVALLAEVIESTFGVSEIMPRRGRPVTLRAHQDLVRSTKMFLARWMRAPLSLTEIALAVHCSPFHLARMFRREAGMTMHKYLLQLRLREALERLAAGEIDLTVLALELGFSSHSHFSDVFRRHLGITPSGFVHSLKGTRSRQISKNLKA